MSVLSISFAISAFTFSRIATVYANSVLNDLEGQFREVLLPGRLHEAIQQFVYKGSEIKSED